MVLSSIAQEGLVGEEKGKGRVKEMGKTKSGPPSIVARRELCSLGALAVLTD